MKKTAFTFALGALAAAIPAIFAVRYYRQKDLEELIDQRHRLQKQIQAQRSLLEQVLVTLEENKVKEK